jgi:hypothetical protein
MVLPMRAGVPRDYAIDADRWTIGAVGRLIRRDFGLAFSRVYVRQLIIDLGFGRPATDYAHVQYARQPTKARRRGLCVAPRSRDAVAQSLRDRCGPLDKCLTASGCRGAVRRNVFALSHVETCFGFRPVVPRRSWTQSGSEGGRSMLSICRSQVRCFLTQAFAIEVVRRFHIDSSIRLPP